MTSSFCLLLLRSEFAWPHTVCVLEHKLPQTTLSSADQLTCPSRVSKNPPNPNPESLPYNFHVGGDHGAHELLPALLISTPHLSWDGLVSMGTKGCRDRDWLSCVGNFSLVVRTCDSQEHLRRNNLFWFMVL